ncbi:hypothetical protein [Pseudomonas putida]|uniref:hypothetical protein n=1 Tax=Pseudomonas putida TaxID=303 RepID=UPI0037C92708
MSKIDRRMATVHEWHQLLSDTASLLKTPKRHHRELLHQAYALRDAHEVDGDTLAEMLELADEALMYAHAVQEDQHW